MINEIMAFPDFYSSLHMWEQLIIHAFLGLLDRIGKDPARKKDNKAVMEHIYKKLSDVYATFD